MLFLRLCNKGNFFMVIVLSVNAGRIMKKAHQGIGVTVASFELAA
jgi:hypothetical protein